MGSALLTAALDFCRDRKYSYVFLWTVSAQKSARVLYGKAGFRITETSENESWGFGCWRKEGIWIYGKKGVENFPPF